MLLQLILETKFIFNMMKNLFLLSLLFAFSFTFTACEQGERESTEDSVEQTGEEVEDEAEDAKDEVEDAAEGDN